MAEEQRTPEWFAKRCGKFTGSRFADVMARSKKDGKPLKAYNDLIWQIVVERMTGTVAEGADSYSMRWGRDVEGFAREEYELLTGMQVEQIDFIEHQDFAFVGCSPDGLVGDGGLELKCPKDSAIHLERFLSGVPEEYIPQVQGCMWVTGRQWWDFASYDPRMPETHRILRITVQRDQDYIDKLQSAVIEADAKVKELYEQIMKKGGAQ
jgi:predicted phage-related endonuclease